MQKCGISFVEYLPEVLDEVIARDCYGIRSLPQAPDVVVDGGACFGAFSLFAWSLGVKRILAYEPDPDAVEMFQANIKANPGSEERIIVENRALAYIGPPNRKRLLVKAGVGHCRFDPAEARFPVEVAGLPAPTQMLERISTFLKLDVEGAERELFHPSNRETLRRYDYISMEWHNCDGAVYALVLGLLGFSVYLAGCDGAQWEPGMSGGIIRARKL